MGRIKTKSLQKLCINRVISLSSYLAIKKLRKKRKYRMNYVRTIFRLYSYTNEECMLYFRFSKQEINYLVQELKVHRLNWFSNRVKFTGEEGLCILLRRLCYPNRLCDLVPMFLSNRVKFTGEEGLCILLRRLCYPNRLCDLVPMFLRDESSLSQIFSYMVKWIYKNHAKRLHCLNQPYLTRMQLQELADNCSESGCPYPNVIGFIDGTCRPLCRPIHDQRNMYSGYKKRHVAKWQSVVLTNGIIGRLDGPFIGRRHDAAIVHLSSIVEEMKLFLVNNDGSYWALYGDIGYSNQKFIKVGFKNHTKLNAKQKMFNKVMSSLRVGVEYGFGLIVQQFAHLDFGKTQKMYLSPLKEMYYTAAFLVNCQTCIRGRNQISTIFNSYVPTLQEYLC